jgi:uroporphyrinogen-III synthase
MAETPAVIVTRPTRDAESWVMALQAQGIRAESLPLIEIAPLPDTAALGQAWRHVAVHWAVMFVSANAVRFFMAKQPSGLPWPACRAWSTGPGTQAALLACGWPAEKIDSPPPDAPRFDSEALWALVSDQVTPRNRVTPTLSVLMVRGTDAQGQMAGRDWLTNRLEQVGVQVHHQVAYARQAPVLTPAQQLRAEHAMTDGSRWLFSSSEAAQHLLQACPELNCRQARALATHPRIAQRLLDMGWERVEVVPAGLEALVLSIKSLP